MAKFSSLLLVVVTFSLSLSLTWAVKANKLISDNFVTSFNQNRSEFPLKTKTMQIQDDSIKIEQEKEQDQSENMTMTTTTTMTPILDDNASMEWWNTYWNTNDTDETENNNDNDDGEYFLTIHPATKVYIVSEYNRLRQDGLDWFWYGFLLIFLILSSIILILAMCFYINQSQQHSKSRWYV